MNTQELNLPQLLDEQNQLQAALNSANQLASMLPRAIKQQEQLTIQAAVSGLDEDRQRLEAAMSDVRLATESKATAELLRDKLAENSKALEVARTQERALEAEALRRMFDSRYVIYKDKCEQVRAGLRNLISISEQYKAITGNKPLPNWDESRERWLNLPATEPLMNDVINFQTGHHL